jgi:hypothetical protein
MFQAYQELTKKTIYMGMHLLFGICTMALASFFWFHWWAQFTFICLIIGKACYNASKYYVSTFEYEDRLAVQR